MDPDKDTLRASYRALRRAMTPEARRRKGAAIAELLFQTPEWRHAESVGCYAALPEEVPTEDILTTTLAVKKRLFLPALSRSEKTLNFIPVFKLEALYPGPLGILQPPEGQAVPLSAINLLLLPGVAFDHAGTRLGFGGGYFDRLLTEPHGTVWGLAFSCQLLPHLPREPHDIRVARILTEQGFHIPP